MTNRLSREKSPYLLQHADNPVDWYPWSDEAFKKAGAEDKPIFLSIGYATCHWCHVMAHESFEDAEVAKRLNDDFIAIKVDREERPDVDQIYMTVCQAMTGRGGWPLSVFMTPDRKPFFAGTYFPKENRMGMPGFMHVLEQLGSLWKNHRQRVLTQSDKVTEAIQPKLEPTEGANALDQAVLERAFDQLRSAYDSKWGGFGAAPKFPTPHQLTFLLRWYRRSDDRRALEMVEHTLRSMRHGGIFDHLGFGFHRYSVDERWLVPHFEKMLYDQAMLTMAYCEAYQVTKDNFYGQVAREVLEYVLRDMTAPGGGFYCAEDADSEGREGLFYVWTPGLVREVLGEELGALICRYFDISNIGNFEEGWSIPHITKPPHLFAELTGFDAEELRQTLDEARRKLFEYREQRIHPLKDDKVLTSWNGLMIVALAKASQVFSDVSYYQAGRTALDFILEQLRDRNGRLFRRWRDGEIAHRGFLDDYAFMIWAMLELYESSFDPALLQNALDLQHSAVDLFWDEARGGFHYTGRDGEALIVRDKEVYDGAVPSSNSIALLNLLRLSRLTGDTRWEDKAEAGMRLFGQLVADYPMAYTQFLHMVDFAVGPSKEIVVSAPGNGAGRAMLELLQRSFIPNKALHYVNGLDALSRILPLAPFLEPLKPVAGAVTAYLCEGFSCQAPITDLEMLKNSL